MRGRPGCAKRPCSGLGFLGLVLDDERNHGGTASVTDRRVSPADTAPAVLVVQAREDLEIARQVRALLSGAP